MLLVIGLSFVSHYIEHRIPEKLKELVAKESSGQYRLDFEEFQLSLFSRSLVVSQVKLTPDTMVYRQLDSLEKGNDLLSLETKQLSFSGVDWLSFMVNRPLSISAIQLEQPVLKLYSMRIPDSTQSGKKSFLERLPKFLKGAEVGSIHVQDLSLERFSTESHSTPTFGIKSISLDLSDLRLDSAAVLDTNRVWMASEIQLKGSDVPVEISNKWYNIELKELFLSTKEKKLSVDSFLLIPKYKEREFTDKFKYSVSVYQVSTSILMEEVDFKGLFQHKKFHATSLLFKKGELRVFTDKAKPGENQNVIRNAPHLAFQRLKIPFNLDRLKLDSVDIVYREHAPKSGRTGQVSFLNITGEITGVTNDPNQLKKNPWARANFATAFMGRTPLKVELNFNLLADDGDFSYKGSLGSVRAEHYNKEFLEPLTMIRAEKGVVHSLSFDVKANKRGSYGTVNMRYSDLKVSILVKGNSGAIGKDGLFSFIANKFLVTSDNPIPGLPPRVGHFRYSHAPNHSFFNLMWKSIFEGIKGIALETKEQKKEDKRRLKEIRKEEEKKKKE